MEPLSVLQYIIDRQVLLQQRLKGDGDLQYGTLNSSERLTFIATAIMAEGAELLEWLPWKPHKRSYRGVIDEPVREEALTELVDLLHYVVAGFIELGVVSEQEVLERFLKKNTENHRRQDEKY